MTSWGWDYSPSAVPFPYGETLTYSLGLSWLDEVCETVEDWGCGTGYGRRFVTRAAYTGIDAAPGSAGKVADLTTYTSAVDGVFIRHVLEHNRNWQPILRNAVMSAGKRLVLVIFTPFQESTRQISSSRSGVPDIGFREEDLTVFFTGFDVRGEHVDSGTQYGGEHIFYAERQP